MSVKKQRVVVAGLGEIGKPLLTAIGKRHHAIGVDIAPPSEKTGPVDILHICYPFEIRDFAGETERYIHLFAPSVTIINSTVAVGTTRAIANRSGAAVVNSPVRGKHACMLDELYKYAKFVGAIEPSAAQQAVDHFESLGFTTRLLSSPEATELAKLTETSYFGLLIAWAQEVERYCDQVSVPYDEVVSIYEEIGFFPQRKYVSGIIGGHCVMPNLKLLGRLDRAVMADAIRSSNQMKIEREARPVQEPAVQLPLERLEHSRNQADQFNGARINSKG